MIDTLQLINTLRQAYPNASCELNYGNNFELLIAVILSAQCTDKRVNEVAAKLFKEANTPQQFAQIDPNRLQELIFSCGFYRNKAASIIAASKDIVQRFDGQVPSTFDGLISLKGVGQKTANVMLSVGFNKNALAVDTHVFRVARRLGLSFATTPNHVERDLRQLFKQEDLSTVHHLMLFHGRYCCKSRMPSCKNCAVAHLCKTNKTREN